MSILLVIVSGNVRGEQLQSQSVADETARLELLSIDSDPTFDRMRGLIDRFAVDRRCLSRARGIPMSPAARSAMRDFLSLWQTRLRQVEFDRLDQGERIDYLLLNNAIRRELQGLEFDGQRDNELRDLLTYAADIVELLEARQRDQVMSGRAAADRLQQIAQRVELAIAAVATDAESTQPALAARSLRRIAALRRQLQAWFEFYVGYDPQFTWWAKVPYQQLDALIDEHAKAIREQFIGAEDASMIGDPIGQAALERELRFEMICYSPEELIEIARRELAWCQREMLAAARDLHYGEDWPAALEYVKRQYVEPGEQPALIRQQANAAIRFLKEHQLVTIPELCESTWRIEMMSPERQLVNPYFTGGEVIRVSYPTDTMSHEQKLMSLRSNNQHFCWATVHHELIPGHHLQGFMADRYRSHRKLFRTPFLVEGWALHWEMLLWDLGFHRSAEDRVGMLFWRMHRCARIQLSLGFHLNQLQPPEMVDFLVHEVGHERSAAEAEVRRWIGEDYGPLYQAAYMLGGLQLRALHRQVVGQGTMTDREFHDAVLRENAIPIELIRAQLVNTPLTSDSTSTWRFYDELQD